VRAPKGGLGAVKAAANYAASLLAAEVAKKNDYEQVLWTDAVEHRYLEEVGTMNLMVVIGEELITPPLEGTILGGVTRDAVLTLAREGGALLVSERPIGMEELIAAYRKGDLREVFGCGTAAVITPVGELGWKGERMVINGGEVGPLARRLYDTITGIQYGRLPDPWGWMTEVV
jgi:branched-chain amino acid aminotransferase